MRVVYFSLSFGAAFFPASEAVVEGLEDFLVAYRDHSLLVCRLHDEQQIKVWIEELK